MATGLWKAICNGEPLSVIRRLIVTPRPAKTQIFQEAHVRFPGFLMLLSAVLLPAAVASAQFLQQGPKLLGTGAVGAGIEQGQSVALSADGNAAIVGGDGDDQTRRSEARRFQPSYRLCLALRARLWTLLLPPSYIHRLSSCHTIRRRYSDRRSMTY